MEERHPTDLLPAYALGCLDQAEGEQVREHLLACAACRAEFESLEEVCAELAYAASPTLPDKSLQQRLMQSCRPSRSYAWFENLLNHWPRLIPAASLIALVLVGLLGTTSFLLWQQANTPKQETDFASAGMVFLKGTANMPAAEGRLVVDPNSGQGLLLVNTLRPLAKTSQYQLWLIRDGKRTNGGVFSVNSQGMATMLISSAQPFSYFDSFGITIEPYGGSPEPTGQKVLGGKMLL